MQLYRIASFGAFLKELDCLGYGVLHLITQVIEVEACEFG